MHTTCFDEVDVKVLGMGNCVLQQFLGNRKRQSRKYVGVGAGCSWSVAQLDLVRAQEIDQPLYLGTFSGRINSPISG